VTDTVLWDILTFRSGEYYNMPVQPDCGDMESMRTSLDSIPVASKTKQRTPQEYAEQQQKDVIRAADFTFLTVLGKGSFGKVQYSQPLNPSLLPRALRYCSLSTNTAKICSR
jgi:hypothetical protein